MHKSELMDGKVKLWTAVEEVESSALDQLKATAALPWVFKHVAVMPDVHFGIGATVGSVVAMRQAVSPAAVGVDIGCGMAAVRLNLSAADLPDNLDAVRHQIERDVPVGFNWHKQPIAGELTETQMGTFWQLRMPGADKLGAKAASQLGTLGGGNHFIELCLDEQQRVWVMLHSGSRNIGKELAEYHIGIAKTLAHNADLPDKNLAVFLADTPEMMDYRHDLMWAQQYAYTNRRVMKALIIGALKRFFPSLAEEQFITCHHNYVSEETHFGEQVLVTRKGAISAREGEWGIIPGSMGTRSYIVKGKGEVNSFHSASHGAGRRMSRGAAKRQFTQQDLIAQTMGVNCRKDIGVLDEIPACYKDIDQVIANEADLVEVQHTLKQVLCIKG